MSFTAAEKLQIEMLCDLARPVGKRQLDLEFISRAVASGDIWALSKRYEGLELNVPLPAEVTLVMEVFDMWRRIEESFLELPANERTRINTESYYTGAPHFSGFSGADETHLIRIAYILVDDIGAYPGFKGRELNSHFPAIAGYKRMLAVWQSIWERKLEAMGPYELSADELILILREHVHPDHREPQPQGGWTFDRSKFKP